MDEPITPQSVLNKASDDKFLLVLDLPQILKKINRSSRDNSTVNLDKLQFSVEGSIVPEITVMSQNVPYGGQNLAVTSYARDPYQKNRVRFTVDNRFNNYWVLWKWLNLLNDARKSGYNQEGIADVKTPQGLRNIESYQTDISVYALDEFNKRIAEFKYHKAFITQLGGIDYNYQSSNQISSYFEYDFSQLTVELL
jgi:hypothetical protein